MYQAKPRSAATHSIGARRKSRCRPARGNSHRMPLPSDNRNDHDDATPTATLEDDCSTLK